MSWPLSHEFNEAIQNPKVAFSDPDLKAGEAVVGATGLPLPRSGNFADVYQVRGADGRDWAVKCFTRPVAGLGERYAKVSDALAKANLPFAVGFTFLADGIRVGGAWRPVVKMEWVEGLLLNQVARDNAAKPGILSNLAQMWLKLSKRLRDARIAHADIQHGNVLLVRGASAYALKLIDYDGMWVPALANTPSGESGHPSFQHPARAASRAYSPDVDRFPNLAVATALRGLVVGGSALWEKYDNGDNLLFVEADYQKPAASKVMKELWLTEDPAVQALVGRLAVACGKAIPQTPWLDQFAPDGDPLPLDAAARREALAALGIAAPVPVPLPPEPAAVVVPQRAPAPAAPAPAAPAQAFNFDPAPEEVEVELVDPPRPSKESRKLKLKPRTKTARGEEAPRSRMPIYIVAGLLLLVGGVAAGVMLGKPKPPEVVQEEPKEPAPKGPGEVPKPKDKNLDPVPPKPKDKDPDPSDPPPPVGPGAAQTWTYDLADSASLYSPMFSRDGSVVAVLHDRAEVVMLDPATGKRLTDSPDHFGRANQIMPLDGGRFARATLGGDVPVWDPRGGKVVQNLPAGGLPFPSLVYVSPTGKYLAASSNAPGGDTFAIKSTNPDKVILEFKWSRGAVHITDDESRVLVADATGRCRWFKLPSGEPAEEWTIDRKGPDLTAAYGIQAVSGDGSAVAFWGTIGDLPLGVYVLDGKTGEKRGITARSGRIQTPSLSRDGRFMLAHTQPPGKPEGAVVYEVKTGAKLYEFSAPEGFLAFRPVLSPDGKGCVATAASGQRRAVVRYEFEAGGAVAVKPPDPPAAPGDPVALKPRWTAPADGHMHRVHLTASGKVVLGGAAGNRGGVAFDAATGAARPEFAEAVRGGAYAFFPLTNGRVGKWGLGAPDVHVWDEQTGKELEKITLPNVPRPAEGGFPFAALSPNARFVANGWTQGGKFDNLLPLRVSDLTTNKEVLKLDWAGGTAHFTADASRLLVAEHTGRCRWFKLPAGAPDGGWELGAPAAWRHDVTSISADGSVVGYFGPLDRRGGFGPATLDGKTGAVLHSFPGVPNSNTRTAVSADGRRVAITRTDKAGFAVVDVADARTGAPAGRVATAARMASAAISDDGSVLVVAGSDPAPAVQAFDVPGAGGVAVKPPDPAPPLVPGVVLQLKPRFSVEAKLKPKGNPAFDADGGVIAVPVQGLGGDITAFDARTGAEIANQPLTMNEFYRLFPLGKGKFGYQTRRDAHVTEWNPATGKTVVNPFKGEAGAHVNVSPNGRYMTVGQRDPGPGREIPESPLRVVDVTTGLFVVTTDWHLGRTLFAADSSRVLVADDTGRFRWFKLPGGQPDGDWTLGLKSNGFNARDVAMSADGKVVLYHGPVPGKELTHHLLDGKTGAVLYSFPAKRYSSYGAVSEDGRFVLLLRTDGFGLGHTVEVRDARGELVAAGKIPQSASGTRVGLSWAGRGVVMYDWDTGRLTVLDLPPELFAGVAVAPKLPTPMGPELDLPELKAKWTAEVKVKLDAATAHFDDDGQRVVLVGSGAVSAAAFNAKTGAPVRELSAPKVKGQFYRLFELDGGRFGFQTDTDKEVLTWEPGSGLQTTRPFKPPTAPGGVPFLNVSPTQRYQTVGHARPGAGARPEATPLQVIDTTFNKAVVTVDWHVGATAFAADSSRVLVADDTGRFRWFKLPGGQPDGEWKLEPPAAGVHARLMGLSGDGGLILFHGQPAGKELTVHLLDGKTGTVLHSFPAKRYLSSGGSVSADGRQVALVRDDGTGVPLAVEVFGAAGAPVTAARLPRGADAAAVTFQAQAVVLYERAKAKLTAYDLPAKP